MGSRFVAGMHIPLNIGRNLWGIMTRGLPWWPFAALAIICCRRRAKGREMMAMAMLLIWIGGIVLFMAVPPKRYDRYLIPACPALAVLAAYGACSVLPERFHRRVPGAVWRICVIVAVLLATVPIPVHRYRRSGYAEARILLDRLGAPGTLVSYDPRFDPGLSRHERQWSLRAATVYYLDRRLHNANSVDQLQRNVPPFVVAHQEHLGALCGVGYHMLSRLDHKHLLLWRPGPAANMTDGGS